jgi:hypothetical protein
MAWAIKVDGSKRSAHAGLIYLVPIVCAHFSNNGYQDVGFMSTCPALPDPASTNYYHPLLSAPQLKMVC